MSNQQLPRHEDDPSAPSLAPGGIWGPSITIGFAAAVAMWVLAWILHMPGVRVPSPIAVPVLMLPLLVIGAIWLRGVVAPRRFAAGALSGLVAGLVNLLILGSHIVKQPPTTAEMREQANQLGPNAAVVILGSLAISILVGLIASMTAHKLRGEHHRDEIVSSRGWRSRFAWVTALTYLPLIAVGGVVTSTDSGLAVPDAVTSYGAISVLFPLHLMAEPRIFFEHSHRLFGTLAGLTTLVLMVRVLARESRRLPGVLGVLLFVAVALQGYMGIIRVADKSTAFAIIHGIFAQLVLALALVTAIILSEKWALADPDGETIVLARRAKRMMGVTFIALLIQLTLGALTRHLNSSHAMMAHMGFAFIVVMLVIVGGALCIRAAKAAGGGPLRILGVVLHGLVVLQFSLGFAVLGLAWQGADAPALPTPDQLDRTPIEAVPALITTLHHITGALVLATAAGALVWARRLASERRIR